MANTITRPVPPKSLIIAAFAALYIIWGSTYTAIIIAIREVPPLLMAGTRFFVAGLVLYLYFRFKGQPTPFGSLGKISFSGILMLFFGTGAVAWVEQYIPSGLAAIIVATTPLWFIILDRREWKFNFSNKWIIAGLVIGFIGVLTLFSGGHAFSLDGDNMKLISFFVLLGGTMSWAIGSLYSKYKPVEGTTGMKAAIQMLAAGSCSIVFGLILGEHHQLVWSNVSWHGVLALVYLIVMGSLVGFTAYTWLLSVRSPTLVGTYAYVNPVVAVFLGWLIASEHITRQQVIALVVILSGVILVTLSKAKKTKL
ncbi:MAG TPA: EamA family transporter [Chitinophagaceae bacterium]|nr:EamA family transporter [Chitinophagaceae bacterium]